MSPRVPNIVVRSGVRAKESLVEGAHRVGARLQQIGRAGDEFADPVRLSDLEAEVERLNRIAYSDALTGAHSRRWLDEHLGTAFKTARQENTPLSFMMIDIDHFKRVNDTFGHRTGDEVLRQVYQIIDSTLKAEGKGSGARYGGEEFAVLLPGMPLEESAKLAELLRATIAERAKATKAGAIKVSIGVADASRTDLVTGAGGLVGAADHALYEAKEAGRNTVRSALGPPPPTSGTPPRVNARTVGGLAALPVAGAGALVFGETDDER